MNKIIFFVIFGLSVQTASAINFRLDLTTDTTFDLLSTLVFNIEGCGILEGTHSYTSRTFQALGDGQHVITITNANPFTDTFLAIYSPSFDPLNPDLNLVACNDDYTSDQGYTNLSQIDTVLSSGTTYEIVVTTYGDTPVNSTVIVNSSTNIALGPSPIPTVIPTLSFWSLVILIMIFSILGMLVTRKKFNSY